MDRENRILLGTAFCILLGGVLIARAVTPMSALASSIILLVAYELIGAALLRRIWRNRKKGSTGLFYFKFGIVLFCAVYLLIRTVIGFFG